MLIQTVQNQFTCAFTRGILLKGDNWLKPYGDYWTLASQGDSAALITAKRCFYPDVGVPMWASYPWLVGLQSSFALWPMFDDFTFGCDVYCNDSNCQTYRATFAQSDLAGTKVAEKLCERIL